MPSSGTPVPPRLTTEDLHLELLVDTLESLDLQARSLFLQRYFRSFANLDLPENQCIQLWEEALTRRQELRDSLGRPISLKTALFDALANAGLFRVPVIIEYDGLKQLQLNAVTDPLTGLYNRRLFNEVFEKELNRARRYGSPLGLVMLDLHRFKEVNDKYGHPVGDEVLGAAATTLKKALRTSDSAFRIGGDEFALLLPQTDPVQSLALSRRVEAVFAEIVQPLQLSVGVSLDHGVANFPQDGDQGTELIRIADERLYSLKHSNRARSANMHGSTTPESANPAPTPSLKTAEPLGDGAGSKSGSPISIETKRPATEKKVETSSVSENASMPGTQTIAPQNQPSISQPQARVYAVPRKAERVSMAGTNAYAVVGENGTQRARVLDLGFGGVALEMEVKDQLPENLLAILHVPILPPVRVNLKPIWRQLTGQGVYRIGCAFIS